MDSAFFNEEIISIMVVGLRNPFSAMRRLMMASVLFHAKRLSSNQVFTMASMMAHNLSRETQMIAHPAARRAKPKRPSAWKFKKLDTLGHQIIQRTGRLSRPMGKLTLTMSPNR